MRKNRYGSTAPTRKNTFTKRDGSTFTCDTCGRRTRHTGVQSIGSTLCPQCFDLAGYENEISDGHATFDDLREQIAERLQAIRERGGSTVHFAEFLTLGEQLQAVAARAEQPAAAPAQPAAPAPPAGITVITTEREYRHHARTLDFSAATADHIDWNRVATTARELGAQWDVRHAHDGATVITMWWPLTASEAVPYLAGAAQAQAVREAEAAPYQVAPDGARGWSVCSRGVVVSGSYATVNEAQAAARKLAGSFPGGAWTGTQAVRS